MHNNRGVLLRHLQQLPLVSLAAGAVEPTQTTLCRAYPWVCVKVLARLASSEYGSPISSITAKVGVLINILQEFTDERNCISTLYSDFQRGQKNVMHHYSYTVSHNNPLPKT